MSDNIDTAQHTESRPIHEYQDCATDAEEPATMMSIRGHLVGTCHHCRIRALAIAVTARDDKLQGREMVSHDAIGSER